VNNQRTPGQEAAADPAHQRPPGASDQTVEAAGKISEALEWVERARGRLYDFHQMLGRADLLAQDAADLLEKAGHDALAGELRHEVVGRNVLYGRWTFQIVEEFDDLYHRPVTELVRQLEQTFHDGQRHVYEARMKEERRTHGRTGHERRPAGAHDPGIETDRDQSAGPDRRASRDADTGGGRWRT
jgi:hypothetical protein